MFRSYLQNVGVEVKTLDLDPSRKPDYVADLTRLDETLPAGLTFDAVCAFQVLEHLPYETSLQAFRECVRVSRRHVLISLPDARPVWSYQIHVSGLGRRDFVVHRPQLRAPVHVGDPEHQWEINKRGFPLSRFLSDFSAHATLTRTYRVRENPYHRFRVFTR